MTRCMTGNILNEWLVALRVHCKYRNPCLAVVVDGYQAYIAIVYLLQAPGSRVRVDYLRTPFLGAGAIRKRFRVGKCE
jgi:hypothetical protein